MQNNVLGSEGCLVKEFLSAGSYVLLNLRKDIHTLDIEVRSLRQKWNYSVPFSSLDISIIQYDA